MDGLENPEDLYENAKSSKSQNLDDVICEKDMNIKDNSTPKSGKNNSD